MKKKKKQTGEGEEMTKRSSEETTGEGWRRRHVEQPKLEAERKMTFLWLVVFESEEKRRK